MEEKTNFAGLDLVRFAAAAMVMWYHLAWWSWFSDSPILAGRAFFPELAHTATFGGVGVEVFFVISGFVIALTAQGRTPGQFARSRFLRLYPTAWVCASITALVLLAYEVLTPLQLFAAWVRTLVLWPFGRKVDGVYWTLVVEIVFYALVWLLLKTGQWKRFGAFLIALGLPGTGFILYWMAGGDLGWFNMNEWARLTLVRHGFLFALGGLMWMMWAGRARKLHKGFAALYLIVGALSIYASPSKAPVVATSVWLVSVAVMAVTIRWHRAVGVALAGVARPVKMLGLATYPLYLLHHICGVAIMRLTVDLGASDYGALALAIVTMVGVSILVAWKVEPLVKRLVAPIIDWRPASWSAQKNSRPAG